LSVAGWASAARATAITRSNAVLRSNPIDPVII
jgi:hypothetical protein